MRVFKIMSKNARAFRTIIGMSLQQFNFLMRDVEKAYPEAERKRLEHPGRVGACRPFSCTRGTGFFWSSCTTGPT